MTVLDNNFMSDITPEDIQHAEKLIGLEMTAAERELMLAGLEELRKDYEALRAVSLPNHLHPALRFDVDLTQNRQDAKEERWDSPRMTRMGRINGDKNQKKSDDLAFWPVSDLARGLRRGEITSVALAELYLDRLKRYDPHLHCVITLTEERALDQARRADAELRAGVDRGPLHGIPWGAKDLLAVRGYPTTWGATPYQDQVIDQDAAVVQRLDAAGAVLLAKLSMGALAWGDSWFGGQTRTPWNIEVGASGSSSGPGAATAAGLVGFSIGSETYGSIISPSNRNGVTGLRPTFGRVSRHGAMALSWSMDKIGPMCRSAEDCALVFAAIHGPDAHDPTAVDKPFPWPLDLDLSQVRLGYLAEDLVGEYRERENDARALQIWREMGVELVPITLPNLPIDALKLILFAEAAAAFDELTRSNQDDLLVRQGEKDWPNFFRMARFIPAVAYIQANRIRTRLMAAMHDIFSQVDAYIGPSRAGDNLLLTNLSGHPALALPTGLADDALPTTITLTGRLYDETTILALGRAFQRATDFHRARPPLPE